MQLSYICSKVMSATENWSVHESEIGRTHRTVQTDYGNHICHVYVMFLGRTNCLSAQCVHRTCWIHWAKNVPAINWKKITMMSPAFLTYHTGILCMPNVKLSTVADVICCIWVTSICWPVYNCKTISCESKQYLKQTCHLLATNACNHLAK